MSSNETVSDLMTEDGIITDLEVTLKEIEEQILEVEKEAEHLGCRPSQVRSGNGDWPLRSLIVAKAHVINAIVTLRSMNTLAAGMVTNFHYTEVNSET